MNKLVLWLLIGMFGVLGSIKTSVANSEFTFIKQKTIVHSQDKSTPSFIDQIELIEAEETSDQHVEPITWPIIPAKKSVFEFDVTSLERLSIQQQGWRTPRIAFYLRFENLRI